MQDFDGVAVDDRATWAGEIRKGESRKYSEKERNQNVTVIWASVALRITSLGLLNNLSMQHINDHRLGRSMSAQNITASPRASLHGE